MMREARNCMTIPTSRPQAPPSSTLEGRSQESGKEVPEDVTTKPEEAHGAIIAGGVELAPCELEHKVNSTSVESTEGMGQPPWVVISDDLRGTVCQGRRTLLGWATDPRMHKDACPDTSAASMDDTHGLEAADLATAMRPSDVTTCPAGVTTCPAGASNSLTGGRGDRHRNSMDDVTYSPAPKSARVGSALSGLPSRADRHFRQTCLVTEPI